MASQRWFDFANAFSHPATAPILLAIVLALFIGLAIAIVLHARQVGSPDSQAELLARTRSSVFMAPIILIPILAGSGWAIVMVSTLSLFCFREFARMTGLFRERTVSATVAAGICALSLASLDNWQGLFVAFIPIFTALIAMIAILRNHPQGYIQRVSLGIFGFLLIGSGLAHLGFLANDKLGRPMMLMLLVCVQFNDVAAYACGRLFGRHKLASHTSPGKTVEGSLGAILLTVPLTFLIGDAVFHGTPMGSRLHLLGLGLVISIIGQFGDLTVSSIKRDVGVKDTGDFIPGHGGLLDRCNSILLVAPCFFYYAEYINGMANRLPIHLLLGR